MIKATWFLLAVIMFCTVFMTVTAVLDFAEHKIGYYNEGIEESLELQKANDSNCH